MTNSYLRRASLALAASTLFAGGLAGSPLAADPLAGESLARQWCASCHIVAGDQASGGDGAPTFATIASNPAIDRAYLTTWLGQPHDPMPDLNLTAREIDDLIAYIESLPRE